MWEVDRSVLLSQIATLAKLVSAVHEYYTPADPCLQTFNVIGLGQEHNILYPFTKSNAAIQGNVSQKL